MEQPRLPGLPTMAALMLAAMIVAWIGLFGPSASVEFTTWKHRRRLGAKYFNSVIRSLLRDHVGADPKIGGQFENLRRC
jgi:hypothetical protein